MRDEDGRLARLWSQVPVEVRDVVRHEAEAVGRELRDVRSPRQLRDKLADPALTERVADPLVPALDRISEVVGKASVPLRPGTAHALVTASAAVGSTVSSGLETLGALGIEAPPAAASAFAAAGAVGVVTGLIEFYVTAATINAELGAAGRQQPALLRKGLMHSYLGTGEGPPGTASADRGMGSRLAVAVLRRVATRWVPFVGIPLSVAGANRDLQRARQFARYLATEPDER